MMQKKGKKLTREEAGQLYDDLKKAMSTLMAKKGQGAAAGAESKRSAGKAADFNAKETAKQIAAIINASGSSTGSPGGAPPKRPMPSSASIWDRDLPPPRRPTIGGYHIAIMLLVGCALAKIGFAVVEMSGVVTAERAEAAVVGSMSPSKPRIPGDFTREEMTVLTALDERRAELDARRKRLDEREADFSKRDQVFAAKFTQLKELTESLRGERDKSDRKHESQLDQLANVYGSMNPEEASTLLGQIDTSIALTLLKRMPEKRIAQILATMAPDKALTLTRMLSAK